MTTRLELGESGVFAPGTPVAAEAVADGSGGATVRRRRVCPCGSRTPRSLAPGVDVAPPRLVAGPRTETFRPGTGAVATGRGVEPDVLPTAGVRLADQTRTFMPPAPGDLEHAQQVAGARGAGNWKTSRMVAHYSAGATAERGAGARYL